MACVPMLDLLLWLCSASCADTQHEVMGDLCFVFLLDLLF